MPHLRAINKLFYLAPDIGVITDAAIVMSLSCLILVLGVPGMPAVRLVCGLTLLFSLAYKMKVNCSQLKVPAECKTIIGVVAVMTCYLVLHTAVKSHDSLSSFGEIKSAWLTPVVYLITGGMLGLYAAHSPRVTTKLIINVVFFSMFFHILYMELSIINYYRLASVYKYRFPGLLGSAADVSYLNNIMASIIIADIVTRLKLQKRLLCVGFGTLGCLALILLVSYLMMGIINANIILIVLGLCGLVTYLSRNPSFSAMTKYLLLASSMILLLLPLLFSVALDSRWGSMIETAEIAADLDTHRYWLNSDYPVPLLSNGDKVSMSTYTRLSMMFSGVSFIMQEPYGIGYDRNAYGHATALYYPDEYISLGSHAHSALIDLAIGSGIAGLCIWLFFIYKVARYAAAHVRREFQYPAVLSLLLTVDFFIRSFVDGNMRDHIFIQFMLILGFCLFSINNRSIDAQNRNISTDK